MQHAIRFVLALVLSVTVFASAAARAADTYAIDPVHSMVLFKIKHLNVSYVWGRFNGPTGTFMIDDADPEKSSLAVEVKSENVDTYNEQRDQHLKGPDFFNAKQIPTITFKSKSIKKLDPTNCDVTGDLTLLGVTKELTVKLTRVGTGTDPKGGIHAGFEGSFKILRSDYGMKQMLNMVGDEVLLTFAFEAVKK